MRIILFFLVFVVFVPIVESQENPEKITVCFQPLGKFDESLLTVSVSGVEQLYGFKTRILEKRVLPQSAFYEPRKRYRAEKLLDYLDEQIYPGSGCDVVMGFTSKDISTTKGKHHDWGIFGLGTIGGPSAVVSTHRLAKKTKKKRTVKIRTIKVVNHELGHVLGLVHCPRDGCLMNDARGSIDTVDKEGGLFCDQCKSFIEKQFSIELPKLDVFDFDPIL